MRIGTNGYFINKITFIHIEKKYQENEKKHKIIFSISHF